MPDTPNVRFRLRQNTTERLKPKPERLKALPVAVWVRVYGDLEPFLRERTADKTSLLGFYHWPMAEVVEQTFLKDKTRFLLHRRINAYFRHLAYPSQLREWKYTPLRAISEMPYQRLHGNRVLAVKHLLCDLHFIEASIAGGLLEQLLGDMDSTLQRPELQDIHAVRNAVVSGIVAIRRRPNLALQTIINRLRNESLTNITRRHLLRAEATMDTAGVWLCSMTPFGTAQSVENVVAVSSGRGLFHVLTETYDVDDYELGTHRFVERHRFSNTPVLFPLCIHPQDGKIAWLNRNGIVSIDANPTSLRLRTRHYCLAFFGGGLVGITPEDSLVYFDIQAQAISPLAESLSAFSSISIASDLKAGVVISGDRLPTQRLLLLSIREGIPKADDWPAPDSPVSAAYLDNKESLLLATRGRQLLLFDIGRRQLTRQNSYRTIGGRPLRGVVEQCQMTVWQRNTYAVFATDNGELFVWDISSNALQSRGAYRGLRENDSTLCAIETLPDQGKIIVATTAKIDMISIAGDDQIVLKTPINQCSLSPEGWLITVDTTGKCVTWYKDGYRCHDWIDLNHEPTTVSACDGAEGAAFVGYNTGTVLKLQSNKEPDSEDGLKLFDRAAVSVIALDNSRALAASANGQYRIIGIQPSQGLRDIKPIEPFRNEQFIRHLGKSDDFVSCGRSTAGECNTSAVVIRYNDTREVIFETREWVNDLAVSEDGQSIHAAFAKKVCRYKKVFGRWTQDAVCNPEVTHIVSCGHDVLAVVRQDQGLYWLELWKTEGDYQTIAAMELPLQCTSLCSAGDAIAVGAIDGGHCRISIRRVNRESAILDTVKQVIGFYSKLDRDEFWAAASRRATRRMLGFLRPLDWQKTIMAHWMEFDIRQKTMGHILADGRHSEWIEPFFKRLGKRLKRLGVISEHERESMAKAVDSKQESVPDLQSEKAKAVYLAACFEIGRIKLQFKLDESAKQYAPWWESLLP